VGGIDENNAPVLRTRLTTYPYTVRLRLTITSRQRVAREARLRGITEPQLLSRMIEQVAIDNLFEAVLEER
jgi:hypothetical protein